MADNKNSAHTLVCESQEVLYAKALKKMKADRLIVQHAFKIENYLTAAAMFDEVGDYLDAEKLAKQCRELAEQTRKEQKRSLYQKALELKGRAEKESDYEKAATAFGELGEYEDARKEKEDCERREKACENKRKKREIAVIAAILLIAGLAAAGYFTGFFRYVMGVCYDSMGYYEKAGEIFADLEDLLDSRERAQECGEKVLLLQEENERKELKKAHAGDSVIFGSNQWKVLERQEDQLLLILEQVDSRSLFYQVSYQEPAQEADWDTCSLRSWLNGEVLETIFDEEEAAALVPADASGEEYVTILTADQAETYKERLSSLTGRDYWLQDQGAKEGTAVFVSAAGEVMTEGYSVQARLSVRPVIAVDCGKLAEEENRE